MPERRKKTPDELSRLPDPSPETDRMPIDMLAPRQDPSHAWQGAEKIGAPKGGYDLPTNRDGSSEPMRKAFEVLKDPTSVFWDFLDGVLPQAGTGLFRKGEK